MPDASNTPFTVRYENLTAILAKAIQEIATLSGAFRANLINFLADASNGTLFAESIHAKRELCVDDVCITRDQFLRMVPQSEDGQTRAPSREAPHQLPPQFPHPMPKIPPPAS
jgi:hypothetical protein